MITVALHIEPLLQTFPVAWFRWTARMALLLRKAGGWDPIVVVGERYREQVRESGVDIPTDLLAYLDTGTITECLGLQGQPLVGRMFTGQAEVVEELVATELRRVFKDRRPGLVVAWSPAGYYRKAFGVLPILYSEASLFCRPPFPVSLFLDPTGPDVAAFPARNHGSLFDTLPYGPLQEEWIGQIRAHVRSTIEKEAPYARLIQELRARYRHLALLPLPFAAEDYLFSSRTRISTAAELVWTVAAKLPADTALLVPPHPAGGGLSAATRSALKAAFDNVHFVQPLLPGGHGPCEYLAPHVDAIASISSKVGFLALFYGIPFLSIDGDFGGFFAAGPVDQASTLIGAWRESPRHRIALYWLLTRYNVPEDRFFSAEWLVPTLKRLMVWQEGAGDPYAPFPGATTPFPTQAASSPSSAAAAPLVIQEGADADDLPEDIRRRLTGGAPVPLDALRPQARGGVIFCSLDEPFARGPAVIMTPGSARLDLASPLEDTDVSVVSFDFCLDQNPTGWLPLVWIGAQAEEWQKARGLAVYYRPEAAALVAGVGTRAGSQVSCYSRPGSVEIGRWSSVTVCALPSRKAAILIMDGRVEAVVDMPDEPLITPSALAVGDDLGCPGAVIWAKIANLKTTWDWEAGLGPVDIRRTKGDSPGF